MEGRKTEACYGTARGSRIIGCSVFLLVRIMDKCIFRLPSYVVTASTPQSMVKLQNKTFFCIYPPF